MAHPAPAEDQPGEALLPSSAGVVEVLAQNHGRFLHFLERRVGRREVAEEILQDAFVRGITRAHSLRDGESAVAWFYRLLRNALVDHHRRQGSLDRALFAAAREPPLPPPDDEDLRRTICACVDDTLATLKPEYAEAVRRVDLDGVSVKSYARALGLTASNAGVRLHRARQALRRRIEQSCGTCAEHRCLDCTCRQ